MRGILLIGALLLLVGGGVWAGEDEDFLAARDAYRVGDGPRVAAYAQRLQGTVFGPYAASWDLLMRLDDASEAEIRGFINSYADSPISDRVRAEWLRKLGKKQNWPLFAAEYPLLANANANADTDLACYNLQARLARKDGMAWEEARSVWLTGDSLPKSCGPVFDAMADAGKLSGEEVWARLRLALEQGNTGTARSAAERLPAGQQGPWLDQLTLASENPQRFLDRLPVDLRSRGGRELTIFALYRLARSQPDLAKSQWEEIQGRFSQAEQEYLWGQMAFQAARRLYPEALGWFAKAGRLGDTQLEWRARLALRAQNWNEVLAAINAMSDAGR
jgi:soluble lytic murein transglycosylase